MCPGCPRPIDAGDNYSHQYGENGDVVAYWHISCYLGAGLPIHGTGPRAEPP